MDFASIIQPQIAWPCHWSPLPVNSQPEITVTCQFPTGNHCHPSFPTISKGVLQVDTVPNILSSRLDAVAWCVTCSLIIIVPVPSSLIYRYYVNTISQAAWGHHNFVRWGSHRDCWIDLSATKSLHNILEVICASLVPEILFWGHRTLVSPSQTSGRSGKNNTHTLG